MIHNRKLRTPTGGPVEGAARGNLLSAAAHVFARKGYASASVHEIVERAGVSKPVLYYHFGSKEGVYKTLLREALRDFESRLDAVGRLKGTASLRLRRICEEVFALSTENLDVVRLMHAVYFGPPQGAPFFDFDKPLFRFRESVVTMIRQGLRTGEFRGSVEAMTLALMGACNECVDLELVHPGWAAGRARFGEVIDLVLRGMRRKDGP